MPFVTSKTAGTGSVAVSETGPKTLSPGTTPGWEVAVALAVLLRISLGCTASPSFTEKVNVALLPPAMYAETLVRARTASAEELLVSRLAPRAAPAPPAGISLDAFAAEEDARSATISLSQADGVLPGFAGATEWINSPALTPEALRGKVVLVDFWTFECYNCLNALPHVKELYAKYKDRGFVVIGVHTPEFARERVPDNVKRQVQKLGITYPVVIDNDNKIWNAFHNQYWPAAYYADAAGKMRFYHFGEGRYDEQDKVVAKLLAERDANTTRGER